MAVKTTSKKQSDKKAMLVEAPVMLMKKGGNNSHNPIPEKYSSTFIWIFEKCFAHMFELSFIVLLFWQIMQYFKRISSLQLKITLISICVFIILMMLINIGVNIATGINTFNEMSPYAIGGLFAFSCLIFLYGYIGVIVKYFTNANDQYWS